ncbi:MAG: putative toxin-antitoxin system toxin component, PIN family [Lentisphaerae bacterium]|nr:putative toxin-antitoxin system toxin component, PIN family [Lentisphaerota bacterium]
MIRIVLDTNVLVSGMIRAFGPPSRIVDLMREGHVELVVDDRILAEYAAVLSRPKFRAYLSAQEVRDVILFLERAMDYRVATVHVADLPDADDAPFLELALTAGVPLVTGNVRHSPEACRRAADVLTPAQFLAWIIREA